MKNMIAAGLLLTLPWAVSPAQKQRQPKEPLSLAISLQLTKYIEGAPLPVSLTFKNTSKKRTTFTLPDKDEDPPGFIQARVRDAQGRLLTLNDTLEDGWWTTWVQWSGIYKEKKADRVSLKPGEEYTRTIDLKRILGGCRCLPDGLRVGAYRIQFSYGTVISNEVEITVEN